LSFFVLRLPLIHIINPTLVGIKRGLFMSYMNTHVAFAPAGGIQELSFDEVEEVIGGTDRGVATSAGAIGGGVAAAGYMTALRFASYGARIGVVGGIAGVVGGAVVGGAIGFIAYQIGK
jgi:hypothetical protein